MVAQAFAPLWIKSVFSILNTSVQACEILLLPGLITLEWGQRKPINLLEAWGILCAFT